MQEYICNRLTAVWALLVGATALSWETGHGSLTDRRYAELAVIVVAFVKVRYVLFDFMEVRQAPVILKSIIQAWLIIVCSVLIAIYIKAW
jgi:hypothetical protein